MAPLTDMILISQVGFEYIHRSFKNLYTVPFWNELITLIANEMIN